MRSTSFCHLLLLRQRLLQLAQRFLVAPFLLQACKVLGGSTEQLELVSEGRAGLPAQHFESHRAALWAGDQVFEKWRGLALAADIHSVDRNQGVPHLNATVSFGRAPRDNGLDLDLSCALVEEQPDTGLL